ncbi:HK97-gp10 family putative phage morphogenesis protein [Virgibacillus siamensis]|uniref:HK97-gp10 family putative phage morphogenesis protein n=1 Tax=Virgibacillus siamensis TaxID=480071 RepID=UPI0009867222|nr:HK97-gp10 family putative phage morphogenesis protein [Virgibacillus siamensis]
MKYGVVSTGFPGWDKAVEKFQARYIREIKRIVAETAEMIATQAKALAPVDEGNLKRSIEVDIRPDGLSAEIKVTANYGIFVEFGTGIYAEGGNGRKDGWVYFADGRYWYTEGMKSQPYWRPAVEQGAQYFKSEMNRLG